MKEKKLTPLMQQFQDIKEQYPDTLLLFQVGDFYELFFDDAKQAASFLGITLTKRGHTNGQPIPLCGVPVHALNHYLPKLVKGGFTVAVCDQITEPKPGGVVERAVTNVYTPGTLTDENLLDNKSASYLFSFYPGKNYHGLLFAELMTAQLFATCIPASADKTIESEVIRFFPDEIILPANKMSGSYSAYFKKLGYFTSLVADQIAYEQFEQWLSAQFHERTKQHLSEQKVVANAVHSFYLYMSKRQKQALGQFKSIQFYKPDDFLLLDAATQKNLELVQTNEKKSNNSLFSIIDKAATPMGSRMLKKWLLRPLVKQEAIMQRQEVIGTLVTQVSLLQQLRQLLSQFGDFERVVGRIALNRASLRDYCSLVYALERIPYILHLFQDKQPSTLLRIILAQLCNFSTLAIYLRQSLNTDPTKDWKIKPGFSQELDHLRDLVEHSSQKILAFEKKEKEHTGINSLKVRFNNVHGYYIEVTKANAHAVPDYYQKRQSLVGRERFVTKELQELEFELKHAQEKIEKTEQDLFNQVKLYVQEYTVPLRKAAHGLAHLDALFGLSCLAYDYQYVRPDFNHNRDILITDGRHPVVEPLLDHPFIANDTQLTDQESLWIITGPNMGGKSTYLRQVALISILAQIGAYVPAKAASLSLLDRIFTRIGAGDNLAQGKSTFLVEMEETATICKQATKNSLVILDEVGRGTSTFDGLAIAHAVVEYLYKKIGARCLFATHYHELALLQDSLPGITSYFMQSNKTAQGIIFLYKIQKGVADGSFGIEVAKLADLPQQVIARAQELLPQLKAKEQALLSNDTVQPATGLSDEQMLMADNQMLCQKVDELERALQKKGTHKIDPDQIDFDNLSPKQAFDLLWRARSDGNEHSL